MDFLIKHLEAIVSIIAIVSAISAVLKWMLAPLKKKIEEMGEDIKEIKSEQLKFHTRLTWLEGYLTGHDPSSEK